MTGEEYSPSADQSAERLLQASPLTPRGGVPGPGDFYQVTFLEALPFLTLCLPSFAQRLTYLRMTEELSLDDTARLLGVSVRTVGRWQEAIETSLEDAYNALGYEEWNDNG